MEYEGFIYRQLENAPAQVLFVAYSCDLDDWAKVPTKMSRTPRGFQRAIHESHAVEIEDFFKEKGLENCSPTSILVGIEEEEKHRIQILKPDTDEPLDLSSVCQSPQKCRLVIEFDVWRSEDFDDDIDKEIDALFENVGALYAAALEQSPSAESSVDEGASLNTTEGDEDGDDEEGDDEEGDDEEGDDEEGDDEEGDANDAPSNQVSIETGLTSQTEKELKRDAKRMFEGFGPADIGRICQNREFVAWQNSHAKYRLRDLLKDDRKPGLIIDGQHRIRGTKGIGEVPFSVALLPDATKAELAFQFIVNNSSSRKVSEGLLISIVGNSLSDDELASTEARLNRSGIKVSLIKAVMRVHDTRNPYCGMLQFGIPGEDGFLEAPAMQKKVVSQWYGSTGRTGTRPKFPSLQVLQRPKWSFADYFGHACEGSNKRERAQFWQQDRWFDFFRTFWEALSENFSPKLWPSVKEHWPVDPKTNAEHRVRTRLMRVTVLGLLQSAVLQVWKENLDKNVQQEMTSLEEELNLVTFKKRIGNYVKKIEPEFFTLLKYTGFDASKDVRDDLVTQFIRLMEGQVKFADLCEDHSFWKSN